MAESQSAAVPAAQPRRWPGLLLLIAAIMEFLGGLGALPILAGDLSEVPGPGLGGKIILATIILRPIVAAAALFFLVRGNLPGALVSMAIVILVGWISYLPSIQLHGLECRAMAPVDYSPSRCSSCHPSWFWQSPRWR